MSPRIERLHWRQTQNEAHLFESHTLSAWSVCHRSTRETSAATADDNRTRLLCASCLGTLETLKRWMTKNAK